MRWPVVMALLIAANLGIFLFEMLLPEQSLISFLHLYGAVPRRILDEQWALAAGYPTGGLFGSLVPMLTHMFLHGGWWHLLLNMWVMWIFADNVEDAFGRGRFLGFYVLSGLAALALHVAFNASSQTPVVGASGAIAGVMGAYFRLFPHARVLVLIPIVFIPWIVEVPALVFLGLWFLMQVFSGIASGTVPEAGAAVAWWAHAGGFLFGLSLARLFALPHCIYCYQPEQRAYIREE